MSHWTKSKCEIKDLGRIEKVAKELGCKVKRKKTFSSRYAGKVESELVISAKGGSCAIVQEGDHYTTIIDNYYNPITEVVGRGCSTLTREYSVDLVKSQAMMMGGIVSKQDTLNNGDVEIHISI